MIEKVKEQVKGLLEGGEIKGFLGLCNRDGQVAPHLFTEVAELDHLVIGDVKDPGDARYPLNKLLIHLYRAYPEERFGVLVRGCDERGLNNLYVWNQLAPKNVVTVGIPCPQELADACGCPKPYPDNSVSEPIAKGAEAKELSQMEALEVKERFAQWMEAFSRCIKCYGCRDICPMCFCKECSLELEELIPRGEMPPEIPIFHLVRAVHMAGRCIDCGLCNEACPVDIPLRTLYKKVGDIVYKEFSYRPGLDKGKSPLNVLENK